MCAWVRRFLVSGEQNDQELENSRIHEQSISTQDCGSFWIFRSLVRRVRGALSPGFTGTIGHGQNLANWSALSSGARRGASGLERMAAYSATCILPDSNRSDGFQWFAVRFGIDQFQMVWRDHAARRYWDAVRLAGPSSGERGWKRVGGRGRTRELKESAVQELQNGRSALHSVDGDQSASMR